MKNFTSFVFPGPQHTLHSERLQLQPAGRDGGVWSERDRPTKAAERYDDDIVLCVYNNTYTILEALRGGHKKFTQF